MKLSEKLGYKMFLEKMSEDDIKNIIRRDNKMFCITSRGISVWEFYNKNLLFISFYDNKTLKYKEIIETLRNEGQKKKIKMVKKLSSLDKNRGRKRTTPPTGILRVYKLKSKTCKQGFIYCYKYYDSYDKEMRSICSVSIDKLKEKVEAKGLPWVESEKKEISKDENDKF